MTKIEKGGRNVGQKGGQGFEVPTDTLAGMKTQEEIGGKLGDTANDKGGNKA